MRKKGLLTIEEGYAPEEMLWLCLWVGCWGVALSHSRFGCWGVAVLVGALPLLRPSRFKGAKPPQTTATTTTAFGSASNHPQVVRAKSTEGYFLVFYNNVYIQKARASR